MLGARLLVCDRRLGRLADGVVGALAATGSMTLTLYTVHVVAADAQQQVVHRGALLATHIAVAMLAAVLWRHRFRRGPLEQLVHTVSHGRCEAQSGQRRGGAVDARSMSLVGTVATSSPAGAPSIAESSTLVAIRPCSSTG